MEQGYELANLVGNEEQAYLSSHNLNIVILRDQLIFRLLWQQLHMTLL